MTTFTDSLFHWLVASTWQSALFIAFISLAALAAHRASARLRYILWMLVLVKVAVPPSLSAPWGVGTWAIQPLLRQRAATTLASAVTATANDLPGSSDQIPQTAPMAESRHPFLAVTEKPVPSVAVSKAQFLSQSQLLLTIWAVGGLIYLGAVFVPYLRLRRRLAKAEDVDEGPLAVLLEQLCLRLGIQRSPRLIVSSDVGGAFLFGTVHPTIAIPASLAEELTTSELESVLLHELVHLKRGDIFAGWLQVAAQAVFWFHPLVWYTNSRLREERERAVDETIVSHSHAEPRAYAETLLKSVLASRGRSAVVPGYLGIFERNTRLQGRLEEIMNHDGHKRQDGLAGWLAIAALGMVAIPMSARPVNTQEEKAQGATSEVPAKSPEESVTPAPESALTDSRLALLNETQRLWLEWTERQFGKDPDPSRFESMSEDETRELEQRWITILQGPENNEHQGAINGLAAMRSRKAVGPLLHVAMEDVEKNNRSRWMAVRALGLLGDTSVVPRIIHLVYHGNQNTRLWAQISLVRLTNKNFEYDWKAWGEWWNRSGGTPKFDPTKIEWIKKPEDKIYASQEKQMEIDRDFVTKFKTRQNADARPVDKGVPQIVSTSPVVGTADVDPATTAIIVVFDKDMAGGFSWTGGGPEYPTSPVGQKPYWQDPRTCVLPVKLEAGSYYRVGINSTNFQNFRSVAGTPANPSAIYFTTQGASDELKEKLKTPKIVSLEPANNATDVDPATTKLVVTFDVPMGGGMSWTGGPADFPDKSEGAKVEWSADKKTCTYTGVKLHPGRTYTIGLNIVNHKNFQSESGIPLEPVLYRFTTSQ